MTCNQTRICRIINGVVTDTESGDPEAYIGLKDDFSNTSLVKLLLMSRRKEFQFEDREVG